MDGRSTPQLARCMLVKAIMPERLFNLVVPLPHEGTAMRTTDTAGQGQDRSGAVSQLIGASLRPGDVDSTNDRSTPVTPTMPGIRTSTMATRTTTTSPTQAARASSADQLAAARDLPTLDELVQAYLDCRRTKRNSLSALAFEQNLSGNLVALHDELLASTYRPGRSICFVITRPKAREVWAADFRDRIVHHLLYNRIAPSIHASFIADTCACIPGRGTLYGARRLEAKVRSVTENWSRPAFYLKCDLANFFVQIDKNVLRALLAQRIDAGWWMQLADTILFHDPRQNYELRGARELLLRVPPNKRLTNQPGHLGLPIGNLSSQFFANVYLNELDQFVKHRLHAPHYIRYVDDFILLDRYRAWLDGALEQIAEFLPRVLHAQLNPKKTILQPVDRGVDFVGQVVRPWSRTTRRRTVREAAARIASARGDQILSRGNSYFGLLRQAEHSHADRAKLAWAVLNRGHIVNGALTKTFRKTT